MTSKEDTATKQSAESISEPTAEKATTNIKNVVTYKIAGVAGTVADLALDIDPQFKAATLKWKGEDIASVEKGETVLKPKVKLNSQAAQDDKSQEQIENCLSEYIENNLKSLVLLDKELNQNQVEDSTTALTGEIKEIAAKLLNQLGIMNRSLVEEKLKAVSTENRKGLWRFKVKIGATSIFIPFILKPAPTQLRLFLWALFEGEKSLPTAPTPGMVWVDMDTKTSTDFYRLSGYSPAGKKAVRVDMIERLADAVRPLGLKGASFEVTPEVMGLVGLSGEDFANVMNATGYQSRKHKRQEEGKEEIEFFSFTWLGTNKKPNTTKKPRPKKAKKQASQPKKKKEFVMDPNSPFAALAGLKDSLSKNNKK